MHPHWPQIEGIDADDAQARWAGDVDLFLGMLERFLGEFTDVSLPTAASGSATLVKYGKLIHKLRGGASILGATEVRELAGELELACAAAAGPRTHCLAATLACRLEDLRRTSTPAIQTLRDRSDRVTVVPDPADAQRIAELIRLLHAHSLAAAPLFCVLSSRLRVLLGHAAHRTLSDHIDDLRFEVGAKLLEPLATHLHTEGAQGEAVEDGTEDRRKISPPT